MPQEPFTCEIALWVSSSDTMPLCSHRPHECTAEPHWWTHSRSSWDWHAASWPRTVPERDGWPWSHGTANAPLRAATPWNFWDGPSRHGCGIDSSSTE